MPRRFWTCTIITTISALVSAGFSVAGLLAPSSSDSFARYAASRSIALLIAVLFCLGVRSREGIAALAVVMSLVQGFDGIIGILAHDPAKTYGPFVFAPANFVGLVWLLGPTERVGEKVFYGRHLSAAKPKVNSAPELVSDVECSAAPEPGVGKFRFSRGTEFVGLGDDDASLLWSCEKQFSTKELQEAPLPKNHRKLQDNHDVFNEYSR